MAQSDSDEFELVDSNDVARQIIAHKKPNLAKIRTWLNPTNYTASSSEYSRHLSSQAPGTGEWIRETTQFKQWHSSNDHASIWIKAVPGAGKSVVSASMVDSLARKESVPVLYFFFRQIIETNRTTKSLLRDWLAQLLNGSEILQVALWEMIEDNKALESISTDQLWKLLLTALRCVAKTYIIVDALDEMTFDEDFLGRLNAMGSFRPANVKVLMTSRPKQYLQRAMKDPQVIHVSLEEELVKRDISVFVSQRTSQLRSLSPKSQQIIKETVCTRSQGLFLYARLMLDQVANSADMGDLGNEAAVHDLVNRLPIGLEDMYNKMLFEHANLSDVGQGVQVLILQLVTQAARPLRLIEIANAIDVMVTGLNRDSKDIVRTACGPLLEIMEDEVVQILHHSFTEFLLDLDRINTNNAIHQFPVIDPIWAHREIAIACLTRLRCDAFDEFKFTGQDNDAVDPYLRHNRHIDFRPIFLKYPLVEYAAKNWTYHAKQYDVVDRHFFKDLDQFCALDKPSFLAWLQLMGQGNDPKLASHKASPLHVAAAFGLTSWAKHLIGKGGLDDLDGTQTTALFWAAKFGHHDVAEVLLKAGAKPDVDGYNGLKPLHEAASRNHWMVARLLLKAGVSPLTPKTRDVGRDCGNTPTSIGHSPLRYASMAGHTETVVEMIPYIEKNQDLQDSLCWAAAGGHSKLVKALLDHSTVSPNAVLSVRHESISVTTGGETALMLAAKSLDPECVRVLLERGADVGKPSLRDPENEMFARRRSLGNASYPLHSLVSASVTKETESAAKRMLDMLIAAGANLEAKDGTGNTPLLSVLGGGWSSSDLLPIITMLLNAGADLFAEDNQGDTLLHRTCAQSSNLNIAEKLLELKVSPTCKRSSDGATPLHAAMANIHKPEGMSKLLLDHGANIDEVDANGNTPLLRICPQSSGKPREVIDFLIEAGANPNIQNNLRQTCLHVFQYGTASWAKNGDQLQRIINAGADLELTDREGKTVLHAAIEQNSEEMVEGLFKFGNPALNARTFRHGKSALHLACHTRSPAKMIQILVDHGADPTWSDSDGNSILHEAASIFTGTPENIELVEKLLQLKVPVKTQNSRRRTVLHVVNPHPAKNATTSGKPTRRTVVSLLQQHCPDLELDVKDIDGYTPLHLAVAASESVTFRLLQAGAKIDVKAHDFRTPLHCAARARQSGIIAMLLHHLRGQVTPEALSLLVNAADKDGRTPLHDACQSGRLESVQLLFDAGADVMLKDKLQKDTLSICAEFMDEDRLWGCLRNNQAPYDEFRPCAVQSSRHYGAPKDTLQHGTARIAPIVSLCLRGRAEKDFVCQGKNLFDFRMYHHTPLSAALGAECIDMLRILRDSDRENKASLRTKQLLYAGDHATEIIESCRAGEDGIFNPPTSFMTKADDAMMDAMIKKGVDFSKAEDNQSALHIMAEQGLTEKMIKVIEAAKLVEPGPYSPEKNPVKPLLHMACERSVFNIEMLDLLVNKIGVDVSAHLPVKEQVQYKQTGNLLPGSTALHVLANGDYWWQVEAIKFLVDHGAEIDSLDDQDRTPLDIASGSLHYINSVSSGFFRPQCLDRLLKLGANPNRINKHGLVPLNHAGSDADVIKILLQHGANVNVGTKGVLMSAVETGNIETIKVYLENGADCNVADTSRDDSYSSWTHRDLKFRYPLLMAALPPSYGGWDRLTSRKMIDLFLDHGAKLDHPVSDKDTLLHFIFDWAPTSVLRSFIDRPDFNPNMRDQKGRTLFLAACESRVGMDVDSAIRVFDQTLKDRLKSEYIPAYLAMADSELHGASVDYLAVDNEGKHMINYLLPNWSDEIAKRFLPVPGIRDLMRQKDNAGFSPLHHALKIPKVAASQCFIDEGGADLLEPNPNGDTALHHLHRCHYVHWVPRCRSLMERYIQLGGDINARNAKGETALFAFIQFCNPATKYAGVTQEEEEHDALKFFIDNGYHFKAVNKNGETALHMVSRRKPDDSRYGNQRNNTDEDYNSKLFRRLVDLGCDPLQEDNEGRTALDVAASMENEAILKLYQRKKVEPQKPVSAEEDSGEDLGF